MALRYGSGLVNSGMTCRTINCSIAGFTLELPMMNGAKAVVMFRAPNF